MAQSKRNAGVKLRISWLLHFIVAIIVCIVTIERNVIPRTVSAYSNENKDTLVLTRLGVLRGIKMETRLDRKFLAFRGIRYAQPPVGELRFLNPKPVTPWMPKIYDATQDGPMCPQVTAAPNVTDISEDCLRLNVYTHDLHAQKPVIVYLHPGGFYAMSAQSKNFAGPQHFMDRDIVLVTVNYRLASLGFLATGTADAPGNAGLKDQVEALRWVQAHISNFGGDPNMVTLFGYSAGSVSVGLHMLSPMSRGLFHRGIAMSASPLAQWDYFDSDMRLANRQAKLLNCSIESIPKMIDCLRKKPVVDFVNSTAAMFDFSWNPVLNWQPVIEQDYGQERFLIENPYKTMLSGNIHKVPLITGITELEFIGGAFYTLRNETLRRLYNDNFNTMAPVTLLYSRNADTKHNNNITNALSNHYFGGTTELKNPESLEAFGQLYSDGVIGFEYHRFLQLVSRHVPVYTYLFTYKGRYSFFMPLPLNKTYGAVHHDELLYLLHIPVITPIFKVSDPENDTIERLTRLWAQFALKGNPNNENDHYLSKLNWSQYDKEKQQYLEMGHEFTMREGGIFRDRFNLWDKLFPIPTFD